MEKIFEIRKQLTHWVPVAQNEIRAKNAISAHLRHLAEEIEALQKAKPAPEDSGTGI